MTDFDKALQKELENLPDYYVNQFQVFMMGAKWGHNWSTDKGIGYLNEQFKQRDKGRKAEKALEIALEGLSNARFELEMVSKHGGYNHRAIPNLDEKLKQIEELLKEGDKRNGIIGLDSDIT